MAGSHYSLVIALIAFFFDTMAPARIEAHNLSPQTPAQRCLQFLIDQQVSDPIHDEVTQSLQLLRELKAHVAHPEIPSLKDIRLPLEPPHHLWVPTFELSPSVSSPIVAAARDYKIEPDFKALADLVPRHLSGAEREQVLQEAYEHATAISSDTESFYRNFLRVYMARHFAAGGELGQVESPELFSVRSINSPRKDWNQAFASAEKLWPLLIRETNHEQGSSLISSPYPILIPAGRFRESYYWDTYFGVKALLVTQRLELAQMQVENMLTFVRRYGFVPNGSRDYYLSRSQPPVLTSLIREVFEASLKAQPEKEAELLDWLEQRAFPLAKLDYQKFWMNPQTRLDQRTGLNHHWDEINLPRPERHGNDDDTELGESFRDVRAGAESGLDFSELYMPRASRTIGVLLNSLLYKTEADLEWMANRLNRPAEALQFNNAKKSRAQRMNRYLWNEELGAFVNYDIKEKKQMTHASAENTAAMFAGLPTDRQAKKIRSFLGGLETGFGLASNHLTDSLEQWDGFNAWAPFQVLAVDGYNRYGFFSDADRIATNWVDLITKVQAESGHFYERYDLVTATAPAIDTHKYPVQIGFLWTNSSLIYFLVKQLGNDASL